MPKRENGNPKLITETMLHEAVDAILGGMENMFKEERAERNKQIDVLRKEMKAGFNDVQEQIENLDDKISANDRNINGKIKMIKSVMVTRDEFEELREEVSKLKKAFASS